MTPGKNVPSRLVLGAIAVLLCLGATDVRAQHTYNLTAITCGNWNSAGIHDPTTLYQIGYSYTRPNEQIAYFEFDLTPAMGKTITSASIIIPGSTDYSINSYWANPDNNDGPGGSNTNHIQFKVGIRPMCSTGYPETLSTILTGNNNKSLYTNVDDANRNADLGYRWVPEGFHFGDAFDAFHYESTGQTGPYLQNAVNAGGVYILWAADVVDTTQAGPVAPENYLWGSTSYNTGIILTINTSN
jgi:hypothetical protein